jgi:radical SAM-linked protein
MTEPPPAGKAAPACTHRRARPALRHQRAAECAFLSQVKQNIRIRFSKEGDVRFTSHHDLMRVFERALRRAALPVAFSEGHNPRPRISLPAPLSVSFQGSNEVADIGLDQWMRPQDFGRRLQEELPRGIAIRSVEVTSTHPDRQPTALSYRIPLLAGHSLDPQKIDALMAREQVLVERERKDAVKEVDVRRFIKALRLDGDALLMLLECSSEGTARPEEVLQALGCAEGTDYLVGDIERTHVSLSSSP